MRTGKSIWETTTGLHDAMVALLADGNSSGAAAQVLSARFKISISRLAVIGRAGRSGIELQYRPKAAPSRTTPKRRVARNVVKLVTVTARKAVTDEPAPIGPMNDFGEGARCRWIHGTPNAGPWRECGHKTSDSVYCDHHHARAYNAARREAA
jgi:hypothetical protein